MVEDDHILVHALSVEVSSGDNADTMKAEALVQMNRARVARDHRIELKPAEPALLQVIKGVLHERSPQPLPSNR